MSRLREAERALAADLRRAANLIDRTVTGETYTDEDRADLADTLREHATTLAQD